MQQQEVADGLSFYFFHPMARWYAEEKVRGVDLGPLEKTLGLTYLGFAQNIKDNLDPLNSRTARVMLPDLLKALDFLPDKERSLLALDLGWLLQIFGELEQAMELYQESLRINEQLGDLQGRGRALNGMADIHKMRGGLDQAMALYQGSLHIDEQLGDLQGKGAILHEMAEIHWVRGEAEQALELLQESLRIAEHLRELQGKGVTLSSMAAIYQKRGELKQALELLQESLRIAEQLGDLQGKGATLQAMGIIYCKQGEFERAMELYEESLRIHEQLRDLRARSATLQAMAKIHQLRGKVDQALELLQESLRMAEQLGDQRGRNITLTTRGQLLAAKGEKELALRDFVEALVTFTNIGAGNADQVLDCILELKHHTQKEEFNHLWQKVTGQQEVPEWVAEPRRIKTNLLLDRAKKHEQENNWRAAIETYGEALSLLTSRTLSDEEQRQATETVLRLGICLRLDGQWALAVEQLEEAFLLFKKRKDFRGQGLAYLEIARAYQAMNSYDLAMLYYRDASRLFKRAGDIAMAGATHEEAGNLQVYLRAFPGAIADLEEAALLYTAANIPARVAIVEQNLRLALQAQE